MIFNRTGHRIAPGNWLTTAIFTILLIISVGCGSTADQNGTESENTNDQPTIPAQDGTPGVNEAYPALPTIDPDESQGSAYPPPEATAIPSDAYPEPDSVPTGIILSLDRPIPPGSTTVTGVGPPGLFIYILNVTLMGEVEGSGVVDENGNFSISVSPLEENVRLGVTTENALQGITEDNIRPGEGEISLPQVGYFYDSAMVR